MEHLPPPLWTSSGLTETLPVFSLLFFGDSTDPIKTLSKHHQALKRDTPRFGNTPDMVGTLPHQ